MAISYMFPFLVGTTAERTGGTFTNLQVGWLYIETDGKLVYRWNGTAWDFIGSPLTTIGDLLYHDGTNTTRFGKGLRNQSLRTNPDTSNIMWGGNNLPSSGRKYGSFVGSSSSSGDGLFQGNFTLAASVVATQILTAADGKSTRYTTASPQNSNGGFYYVNLVTMRQWNPRFKAKFKLNQTSADVRLWLGLSNSASEPSGDDFMTNPGQGVCLSLRAADTIFQIIRNDGSGASVFSAVTGNPPVDTNAHTIEIIADDANSKFKYSFDDAAYTDLTTDIPAQTTNLTIQAQIETNANPGTRAFELFYLELESDK